MREATDRAVTLRQFAQLLDVRPSYVTQLKTEGRLVLNDTGRVLVAASRQRIADTADPAKDGVRARHAAAREAGQGDARGEDEAAAAGAYSDDPIAVRRSRAQAEKAEAEARKALRDEQIELGQLLVRDDVLHATRAAATELRGALETLPISLAPLLAAEQDEGRCRVLLADAFEHALDQLSRQFAAIAKDVDA